MRPPSAELDAELDEIVNATWFQRALVSTNSIAHELLRTSMTYGDFGGISIGRICYTEVHCCYAYP